MDKSTIINKTEEFVKKKLLGEGTGHDWWHTDRVRKLALRIGREENADLFIIELAALLHDIADYKFNKGDDKASANTARTFLEKQGVYKKDIDKICKIIYQVTFKGALVESNPDTIEGKAVQDADRLDTLGAIGIARIFATGGQMGRPIYDPNQKIRKHKTFKQYKKRDGNTINHFYEKILLLKDMMNTKTGKKIAERRHEYIESYLKRFFNEWEGKE